MVKQMSKILDFHVETRNTGGQRWDVTTDVLLVDLEVHSLSQLLRPQGHLETSPGVRSPLWSAFSEGREMRHV